ncbi:MAG TPA: TetR/AcrR family transcriptional regulator C-terminal domain-containing protein [Solirubrobacteraceae bacterium]|jgi:AcrR family transcriptional regulator|nr:TetR/AcrR family transcriptional regulator C-terminal domain-containing protein [Solirubrobacteraceae bacterium]
MATATRPTGLSRERILRVARQLVDREGLGALSMRRLAQELDVWPMSVYRYFQDKDALLDALAADAAEAIPVPTAGAPMPSAGASWRTQLHSLLGDARTAIGEDPSGIGSRLARAFFTPGALRVSEAGLRILRAAGFDATEAASAWRALWSYTFGFAIFRVAPTATETLRQARTAIAALPDDEYPTLLATSNELAAALATEDEFDYGLDRLLDGLEAGLPSAAAYAGR